MSPYRDRMTPPDSIRRESSMCNRCGMLRWYCDCWILNIAIVLSVLCAACAGFAIGAVILAIAGVIPW